jgi:hypothetical protein
MLLGGVTLIKKLRKNDYSWTFHYIKEYNQMVSYYENIIAEKNTKIDMLEKENRKLKEDCKFTTKQRQICDKDIEEIKFLKNEGRSYSYISNVTGWSKATISRVINNKKGIY